MEVHGNRNLERLALNQRFDVSNRQDRTALSSSGEFGKIPPQVRDFEEVVLGAILIEDKAINLVVVRLKPHHFYVDAHRRIYQAIYNLFLKDAPVDQLTVAEELKVAGDLEAVGGSYYIAQLTNKVGSSANLEYHSMIIIQKWLQRSMIAEGSNAIKEAYEDGCDAIELIKQTSERLIELQQSISGTAAKTLISEVNELYSEMLVRSAQPEDENKVIGLSTGIWKLDQRIYGLCKGHLIILAGNSSEGKSTAMIQTIAENCAKGVPVGCFSLEMTYKELIQKLIALKSGVDLENIIRSSLDKTEWSLVNKAFDEVMKYKLYIDDTPDRDILDVVAIAKLWKMKYNIELLTFDYLQLACAPATDRRIQTREQEVAFISRKLKRIAKDLDIPVLALSQLSRKNDSRADKSKRPVLSDLRDSGSIEQDANIVIFFFRPEKHGIQAYPSGFSTENITEVIVAKCRMGKLGTIYSKFLGGIGRFDNSHSNIKNSVEDGFALGEDEPKKKPQPPKKENPDDLPF